jgi:DNA mismatch repair protein MutS2
VSTRVVFVSNLDPLFFSAELGQASELDLHGVTVAMALGELEHFLHAHWHHREPIVRIIHGRGSGTLRQAIHKWLKLHPKMVAEFRDSTRIDEVGAVTYVAFQRL